MHFSKRVKPKNHARLTEAVQAILLPGEEAIGAFHINRMRRAADHLVVTNYRVLIWVTPVGKNGQLELVDDLDGASITGVSVKIRDWSKVDVMTPDGAIHLGSVIAPKGEAQWLDQLLRYIMNAPATDELRARQQAELAEQIGSREAALAVSSRDQRKALAQEFKQADEEAVIAQAQLFGDGKVTKPMLRTLRDLSAGPDDLPWLVLVSWGEGALAAFDNRAVIMKVGAYTALAAGAMGGGRVATFHFSDITGIEYNSGMLQGVLEILTPSYQGSANKDYWRGSHRSRNADANDPRTLSNTLPLAKQTYRAALPGLNELRDRISKAKQPNIIVNTPALPQPAAPSVADELERLAGLHRSGVLTDEEFQAAKAALIAKM